MSYTVGQKTGIYLHQFHTKVWVNSLPMPAWPIQSSCDYVLSIFSASNFSSGRQVIWLLLLVWHILALILIIITYNENAPNTLGMLEWQLRLVQPSPEPSPVTQRMPGMSTSIWEPSLQTAPGRKTQEREEAAGVKSGLAGARRKQSKASWSGFEKAKEIEREASEGAIKKERVS